jgi:hypothetical protein
MQDNKETNLKRRGFLLAAGVGSAGAVAVVATAVTGKEVAKPVVVRPKRNPAVTNKRLTSATTTARRGFDRETSMLTRKSKASPLKHRAAYLPQILSKIRRRPQQSMASWLKPWIAEPSSSVPAWWPAVARWPPSCPTT